MIYRNLKQKLAAAGIENPSLEARILLREFAGIDDAAILSGDIPAFDDTALNAAVERRLSGEPVSRILGYREFWGRRFALSKETLDPRADTETLIEAVLKDARSGARILDLGTGSGCILLTLLHEIENSQGVGVDISFGACQTARSNAETQGIKDRAKFICGSWTGSLQGQFDIIVSNPPYIPSEVIPGLDANVRNFDPLRALDGGKDGLNPYRNLLSKLKNLLVRGGAVYFEIGHDQLPEMQRLIETADATLQGVYQDLGGHARVLKISYGDK